MTEETTELRECPCCGSAARRSLATERDPIRHAVGCSKCPIATDWLVSEAEAIAAWNTRPAAVDADGVGLADRLEAEVARADDTPGMRISILRFAISEAIKELRHTAQSRAEGEDGL